MSDTPATEAPIKKRGGWQKGRPRAKKLDVKAIADRAEPKAMLSKMKARPNWESDDFVGVGADGVDRLKVSPEKIEALRRDGIALQWITRSIRGMETPQEISKYTRGGWTPVHQSDFDGLLDGDFMPKGQDEIIGVDDCMLVARPIEIDAKARMANFKEARRPLQVVEEQLGRGIPGVTGADHPTATRGNSIKKSFERIEIQD